MRKHRQAPKKPKKTKFPGTMGPLLGSCWKFCFFCFFGACAGLVHLVVCFFVFFGACAGLVTLTSQNIDRHQKNQTTRCTKPAQAPKKPKKLKFPGTMGPLLSSCWNFCFFLVPVNVLWSQGHQTCTGTKKNKKIKVKVEETSTGTKKTKKNKISRNYGPTSG